MKILRALPLMILAGCSPYLDASYEVPRYVEIEASTSTTSWLRERYGVVNNPRVFQVVQGIVNRLDHASNAIAEQNKKQLFPLPRWYVSVLKMNEPNAFSVGAGSILVTRGLVMQSGTEAQLAAVIAHEMAHQLLGHTRDALKEVGTSHKAPQYVFSLEQELEADTFSIELLSVANYDYREAIQALTIAYRPTTRVVADSHENWLTLRSSNLYQTVVDSLKIRPPGSLTSRNFIRMQQSLRG